ncbi:hypothetical protein IJ22_24640 [Paenibacillus naphthalenovorans]|uniref:Uncharacterized protein n=2 Tax=Paenibacillus naphthalenovorans TaxID=162209 RepID=A0A0U2W5Q1_9BACL|nr:hypothetical protein IJ22_24640 [Paenibacillus naphthalenovorans]
MQMVLLKEGEVDEYPQQTVVRISNEKLTMQVKEESPVNWPDLMFMGYCCESFQINRGIYNTAEIWLYRRGFTDIRARRTILLRFFTFAVSRVQKDSNKKFIRFGSGGLTECLEAFMQSVSNKVGPS